MTGTRRILALILLAGVFVMDGYDLSAMPLAVPHLTGDLGLSPAQFGIVFSAVLVGLGGGAALIAPLGDRLGRAPLIIFGCLATALATLGTATADSVTEFAFWRLLTGASLGACLPNCSALSAELASEKKRATVMTLVAAGITVGAMLAGLTAPEVVGLAGWQGLFMLPALFAAALAGLLWLVLPKEALRPAASPQESKGKAPQIELFRRPWSLPFAVFAAALTLNAVNLYLLTQWTPIVLPQAGFTVDQAARVTGLMQGTGFVFGLTMSVLIDRWKPGLTLVAAYGMMTICFLAIGLSTPDPARWTVLLLLGVGGISGAVMALPALSPSLFPSHLLSSAIGMGVLVSRVGAIAGPMIGQHMLGAGVAPAHFIMVAALPTALCALICLALPRAMAVRERMAAN